MVASLAVGLFFLLRSMNKHLHKVSADRTYFSEQPEADAAAKPERPEE
jgi:hypothetical protein